jgi:hypothetical protein
MMRGGEDEADHKLCTKAIGLVTKSRVKIFLAIMRFSRSSVFKPIIEVSLCSDMDIGGNLLSEEEDHCQGFLRIRTTSPRDSPL